MHIARAADTVVMVRPRDFGFNDQTAADNEFQTRSADSAAEITRRANVEFQNMVDRLRAEGVEVLLLEPGGLSQFSSDGGLSRFSSDENGTVPLCVPDAVFPNNWFSTEPDGTIVVFPMMAPNRRAERRTADLERLLRRAGRLVKNVVYLGGSEENERFLEGTGSLVIDRKAGVVYATRSERCHPEQFENFIRLRSYHEGILFDAKGSSGKPVYHTNVVMGLGEKFAVICADAIPDPAQRNRVLQSLERSFDVILISLSQMEEHFCGNILQLRTRNGEPLIVMSARAEKGFSPEQLGRLAAYGKLVSVDLETIETIGGGSARCMLAEIFLPRIPT